MRCVLADDLNVAQRRSVRKSPVRTPGTAMFTFLPLAVRISGRPYDQTLVFAGSRMSPSCYHTGDWMSFG